jgi:hypothetical protein
MTTSGGRAAAIRKALKTTTACLLPPSHAGGVLVGELQALAVWWDMSQLISKGHQRL